MRHRLRSRHLRWPPRLGLQSLAFAPASGSRGMPEAPAKAALVAPARLTLRMLTSCCSTARGAVNLTPIAVAAHQHGCAAARAQEASRRLVAHVHPSQLPRACWTGSSAGATLASHPLSHDTVKGTAIGSNLQVRAAAVPAYLGVGRLQRHHRMRNHWRPAQRACR